jgi:GTP-binding protein Era
MNRSETHRAGFISICGETNVGKSTLLNQILGEKLAIVSRKPQTTRNRILGVKNIPGMQMVFLDSPGLHAGSTSLDRYMLEQAKRVLYESDVALLMVDARNSAEQEWHHLGSYVEDLKAPVLLLINKIDLLESRTILLPLIQEYAGLFAFREIIPISALHADGVRIVEEKAAALLPEGEPLFPPGVRTDIPENLMAAEIVREKVYDLLHQELPYSVAVVVEKMEEKKERNILLIEAVVYVERESQKAIVIGKKGQMLKEIGKRARLELESFFGIRVYLTLWVKVEKNWSRSLETLMKLGYSP